MINLKLLDMDVGVPCYSHIHKNGIETVAALGVAASVLATGATIYASEKSNSANAKINQQNLDFQKQALTQQLDANIDYSARRQAAEEAGYSPYAVIGGLNNVGLSSAPSQIPMQNPVQPGLFDKLAEQLYNYENIKSDIRARNAEIDKIGAETQNQLIQNKYADEYLRQSLEQQRQQALLTGNEAKIKEIEYKLQNQTFDSQVQEFKLRNDLIKHQIESTAADTALTQWNAALASKQYSWIDKLNQAEMQKKTAEISTLYAQGALDRASAQNQLAQALESGARRAKVYLEADVVRRTANHIVDGVIADNGIKYMQTLGLALDNEMQGLLNESYPVDKWFNRITGAAGAYSQVKGAHRKTPSSTKYQTVNVYNPSKP